MNSLTPLAATAGLELVHYFPRQLITADDMRAEQEYFREKLRRHNRHLHGWGVVCGCGVSAPQSQDPKWQVTVGAGYVITPRGDEIYIPSDVPFDLAGDWRQAYDPCAQASPCPPVVGISSTGETKPVYLAVCYTECYAHPVRVLPAGCACDEAACEYSRIRESFELVRLDKSDTSDTPAAAWTNWVAAQKDNPGPLPACADEGGDNCVILATIDLPQAVTTAITSDNINYKDCRIAHSVALPSESLMVTIRRAPASTARTHWDNSLSIRRHSSEAPD